MKYILIFLVVVCLGGGAYFFFMQKSVPQGTLINDPLHENDLIKVTSLKAGDTIQSPLVITGDARGYWYFEASFPVVLLDGNGKQIGIAPAEAKGEWMTVDYVPFSATVVFEKPSTPTGTLILKKDNPSGLPENDSSISIPVTF